MQARSLRLANAAVKRRKARRSALWTGGLRRSADRPDPRGGPRGAAFRTSAFRRFTPLTFVRGDGKEGQARRPPKKSKPAGGEALPQV